MKFKDLPNCSQNFIRKGIKDSIRLDGRQKAGHRKLKIAFGTDYGLVWVSLGSTQVLARISCELTDPPPSRPSEGLIKIMVDLSALRSPYFDGNRLLETRVELVRLLERSIRESKSVDLESLCLIADEKVWSIRLDLSVVNYEGNLIECCSIASIAALAHFRRPDASVSNGVVVVHSVKERNPIPLTVLHYPFCTKFCFFDVGESIVVDPIEAEEIVCDGYLVVASNSYREIITLHISGQSMINKETVLKCCNLAIERSKEVTAVVKAALEEDKRKRLAKEEIGFTPLIRNGDNVFNAFKMQPETIEPSGDVEMSPVEFEFNEIADETKVFRFDKNTRTIGQGGPSKWDYLADDDDDDGNDSLQISDDEDDEVKVNVTSKS